MVEQSPRFLTLADVAEVLNTSTAQVYALVRRGELVAIKIGGRGQWRVEASKLEEYIQEQYTKARKFVEAHPYPESADEDAEV
ncbi:excisionase family DNA binding protein [Nocardioides thalensis]|uniref:Excisionase family DNA binding protein n=1 Tax=Nocardioides thalensis TaxID=1914755 RepID=A0A853BZH7_9ACTN|nr:helix-turn-helix domain-containing protein [Nocardioides thalensis]NYJ00559.1 excisionase family DNA binding protein [Nocardioides thalensis]